MEFEQRLSKIESKVELIDKEFHELKENHISVIITQLETLTSRLSAKVDWKQFWAIVGILTTVVGGMFALLYVEIKDTKKDVKEINVDTSQTKSDVSFIRGKLDNAEVIE